MGCGGSKNTAAKPPAKAEAAPAQGNMKQVDIIQIFTHIHPGTNLESQALKRADISKSLSYYGQFSVGKWGMFPSHCELEVKLIIEF